MNKAGFRCGYLITDAPQQLVLVCIRACILGLFCHGAFLFYKFTLTAFYIVRANWWRKSDEPWITSASFINAFLSWGMCFFGILLGTYFSVCCLFLLILIPFGDQVEACLMCRWRRFKRTGSIKKYGGLALKYMCINFPNTLCCYLLGRSFHDLK